MRRLKWGEMVLVFPEGTRTRDGEIGPFRPGFTALASRSGAAILPVAVDGAYAAWPRDQKFPGLGRIWVRYGPPLLPEEIRGRDERELLLRSSAGCAVPGRDPAASGVCCNAVQSVPISLRERDRVRGMTQIPFIRSSAFSLITSHPNPLPPADFRPIEPPLLPAAPISRAGLMVSARPPCASGRLVLLVSSGPACGDRTRDFRMARRLQFNRVSKRRTKTKVHGKKKDPLFVEGQRPRPMYVDYKNLDLLKKLTNRQSKIISRRKSGCTAVSQHAVTRAIKRARFMALLPYTGE